MKERKLIFKKLTVQEKAEVKGAGSPTFCTNNPEFGNCPPGEVPDQGDC